MRYALLRPTHTGLRVTTYDFSLTNSINDTSAKKSRDPPQATTFSQKSRDFFGGHDFFWRAVFNTKFVARKIWREVVTAFTKNYDFDWPGAGTACLSCDS